MQNQRPKAHLPIDVFCIGRLMVDVLITGLPHIPQLGEESRTKSYTVDVGGNSAITAIALAKLGIRTGLAGSVGADMLGAFLKTELHRHRIDLTCLETTLQPTCLSIELSFLSDRVTFVAAELPDDSELDFGAIKAMVGRSRHLHLTRLNGFRIELLELASETGATTSLDVNLCQEDQLDMFGRAAHLIDFVLPNRNELPIHKPLEPVVKALGKAVRGWCIAKLGSVGAMACDGRTVVRKPCFNVPVADTTGAGDAFNAGFIYSHLHQWSISDSVVLGNAMGALNVQSVGGVRGLPTKEDIRSFLRQNGISLPI